jgi:hypothetical protein
MLQRKKRKKEDEILQKEEKRVTVKPPHLNANVLWMGLPGGVTARTPCPPIGLVSAGACRAWPVRSDFLACASKRRDEV